MTEFVMRLTTINKIELIALASQGQQPHWHYLREFDPDRFGGRGHIQLTDNLKRAKRFPTWEAVFEEWKRTSTLVPLRDDGKPNRPLTAYTMEPEQIQP